MVESAIEFADICRAADYHNFVFSMKASNPLVMVQSTAEQHAPNPRTVTPLQIPTEKSPNPLIMIRALRQSKSAPTRISLFTEYPRSDAKNPRRRTVDFHRRGCSLSWIFTNHHRRR